jgi:hypothetical protein
MQVIHSKPNVAILFTRFLSVLKPGALYQTSDEKTMRTLRIRRNGEWGSFTLPVFLLPSRFGKPMLERMQGKHFTSFALLHNNGTNQFSIPKGAS